MAFSSDTNLPAPAGQPAPAAHLFELARLLERLGVGSPGRNAGATRAQILQGAASSMLAPVRGQARAAARLLR